MRISVLVALLFLECSWLWAADGIKPLDVKLGLWEVTNTLQTSGMPPVSIPPDALAKMTPEQRARAEEAMKGKASEGPKTHTRKNCVTSEKLSKHGIFGQDDKSCVRTLVSSSSSNLEMRVECSMEGTKTKGTFRVEAINPENVKGSTQMTTVGGDRTINVKSSFTGRWIGPDCGIVK